MRTHGKYTLGNMNANTDNLLDWEIYSLIYLGLSNVLKSLQAKLSGHQDKLFSCSTCIQ